MGTILKQYSDNGKTNVLQKSVNTGKADKEKGNNYISDQTLSGIETLIPKWVTATTSLNKWLSNREKQVREKNEAFQYLGIVVRDFWDVLKRRVKRHEQPAEVLTFYGLPLSGLTPRWLSQKDLISAANTIIQGEKDAMASGYPAMQNPGITELTAALDKAVAEAADVAPSDRAYDEAEEAVEQLRERADMLIADLVDELKFNLRRKDPASQRRIIKSYGIEISYGKNETENETEPLNDF